MPRPQKLRVNSNDSLHSPSTPHPRECHEAVVGVLLAAEADVNHADNDVKTALYWATRNHMGTLVDTLLGAGASDA